MKITQWTIGGVALGILATTALAHPGHDDPFPGGNDRFRDEMRSDNSTTNRVSITIEGNYRLIRANGVPDHDAQFPNRGNPNRVSPQNYNFLVPVKPQIAPKPTVLKMFPFGVALNGVVFDPGAAEWWDDDPNSGWQIEPMFGSSPQLGIDVNNAHVQPTGAFHYHGIPTALLAKLSKDKDKMTLIGWAADGFPIYGPMGYSDPNDPRSALKKMTSSYRLKAGDRPGRSGPGGKHDGTYVEDYEFVKGAGDLDECNGCVGPTPEFPHGTYHYFVTEDFPYIPRQFKGTPDSTFFRQGPPGGFGRPRGFGPGPQAFGRPPEGFGPPRDGRGPGRDGGFGPPRDGFGGPPPDFGPPPGRRGPPRDGSGPGPDRFGPQDDRFGSRREGGRPGRELRDDFRGGPESRREGPGRFEERRGPDRERSRDFEGRSGSLRERSRSPRERQGRFDEGPRSFDEGPGPQRDGLEFRRPRSRPQDRDFLPPPHRFGPGEDREEREFPPLPPPHRRGDLPDDESSAAAQLYLPPSRDWDLDRNGE